MTTVTLIPDTLKMNQKVDMAIFYLTDWKLVSKSSKSEKEGISMVFTMKRKITSEMMTTYFPSILLTAITFATTFFKPFFFEAALSVNLTTMLVMTTIFISKMEGLPPTSDIKMIDIWLVLCQMVPFAEVLLLTAIEYNRGDKKKKGKNHKKSRKGNRNKRTISANDQVKIVKRTIMVVAATNADETEEEEKKLVRWRKMIKKWFPSLKTIGKVIYNRNSLRKN